MQHVRGSAAVLRRTSTEPRTGTEMDRGKEKGKGKDRGSGLKLKSPDMVQFAITAATLARDIGNMSACPPAAAAASVVLLILQTVQANHDACARLARRCANILSDLDVQMTGRWESAPPLLIKNLEKFRETLWSIHKYISWFVDMKWRVRFLKKATIEDTLAELDALLSDARQSFQMSTLINIHHAVSSRNKAKKVTGESDNALVDDDSDEDIDDLIPRTTDLFPIDLDKCLSFRDQPEYDLHKYLDAEHEDDANWGQYFQQYRESDIRTRVTARVIRGFGWWEGATEADTAAGKFVLVKRYDGDVGVRRKMLPRTLEPKLSESENNAILQDLLASTRQLIWNHETARYNEYVSSTPDEEECICKSANSPVNTYPCPTWMDIHPDVHVEEMGIWDFGYVPEEKGMEAFVRLGNLIKDELATFSEDEDVSGVQNVVNAEYLANLPYQGLPYRIACWTLEVPPNSRVSGTVTHTARASEEDAWRYLLQTGQALADEFDIPLHDLRIRELNRPTDDFDTPR
ncbi:hypothetical protein C0995_003127 [Termitomyces sp. Mi166|nr:hypothetical protein C0995_003127 [Termitomyces sp. Mi166\